jgi:hypothetical protein
MKKTVCLAGKIKNTDYATTFKKFKVIEELLLIAGFKVINPMMIFRKKMNNSTLIDILLDKLVTTDYLLLFPDWQKCDISIMMNRFAEANNIPVINYEEISKLWDS